MAQFSWLHLSDLHVGLRGSRLLRPEFRDAFERDLRKLHEHSGPWDVVFLSGNLTQTGSPREFVQLDSTLSSLWDYFRSLGSTPTLLAVPGSRDFSQITNLYTASQVRAAFRKPETSQIRQIVQRVCSPFTEWFEGWRHTASTPVKRLDGLLPGDFSTTISTAGLKVGVVGLNAFFRSERGTSSGPLEIDVEQVEAATGGKLHQWALGHDLLLLLTHTPPVMLKPTALTRLREKLVPSGRPFLHLCGGFYKDGWKEPLADPPHYSRWSRAVQVLSLFGDTRADAESWGYAAGRLSASGLRLFPRATSITQGAIGLGPDRLGEGAETLDIPADALIRVPPAREDEHRAAPLPLALSAPPVPQEVRSPPVEDDTREFLVRENVPEPASLPPGVKLQKVLNTGPWATTRLAWSPSGDALAIGSSHGQLILWRLGEQRPSWRIRAHQTKTTDLCFSPDGRTLASCSEERVHLWDEGGTQIDPHAFPASRQALAWSSTGLLATDTQHGFLHVWNTRTWKHVGNLHASRSLAVGVSCLAWSPDGLTLVGGGNGDSSFAFWVLRDPSALLQADRGFAKLGGSVLHVAWMPHAPLVALATTDGSIPIWDLQKDTVVTQLEGHTDAVVCVSFSFDGRLLASQSRDRTILLFRTDTWERVGRLDEPDTFLVPHRGRGLAFSPKRNTLVALGPGDRSAWLWDIDVDTLLKAPAPSTTVHEVSAKVVLVGEGRAGKSCLALRLAQDRYEDLEATHGMRFWSLPAEQLASSSLPAHMRRELILWDMGGQSEYQLVHQLFLRDSTAALMVMEPGRGERALEEIEGWNQRLLAQAGAQNIRKILVGTKLDTSTSPEDPPAIGALMKRCQFLAYLPTSAKTGQGIVELKAALAEAIDWNAIEKVSRPELFQRLRQHIQQLREAKRTVLTFSELEAELRREMGSDFDPEALRSVVGQLARQGLVADTRLADGTRVLVLEIEQVERYAGSLIIAARDNPHGVPAIDVAKVLSPAMQFPRIPTGERLRRDQEMLVLDCVIELLLEHGLCLRHEGLLIFPSLFRPTQADAGADFSHAVSLHYDFSGPIDNIYASLIASLALSRRFGPMRLWQDRAEFGRAGEDTSGVRRVRESRQGARGYARLDVYFDPGAPAATRALFVNLIEEHLREHGVELLERLVITCACGRVFSEDIVRERLHAGHADIGCPACDRRTPLTLGAQQARERNPELARQVHALRTDIQELRSQSITETKVSMTEAKVVKPSEDTPLRILHLSDLHVGAGDDPISLLQPLSAGLRDRHEGLGVERLDYLVISGDITNRAAPAEFEKAREFVSALIEQFGLTAERCILVPGNHDLDWNTEVYKWERKRQVDARQLVDGAFIEEGSGYLLRDEARYPERFKNFSQHFYHPLTQKAYPLAAEEQGLSFLFSEERLQFLALNSAWEIDEYFPERASISDKALSRGLEAANRELAQARKRGELAEEARVLRLAVWHHPITGNEKIQADAFMGRLLQADVRACLHGHVHEDRADLMNHLHSERRIHVMGTGSFGAPTHHRPESVPRLFNLLEVQRDLRRLRVHTRCLRKQGGAWEGWAVWPGEKPGDKRTYYEVALP